jgi:DNA-binding HxlR family transcriptional regulator
LAATSLFLEFAKRVAGLTGADTQDARRSSDSGSRARRKIMIGAAGFLAALGRPFFAEPTIAQLFAEPIVRQLMRRDGTDEATIRRLLQKTAAARQSASKALESNEANIAVRCLHNTAQLRFSSYECAILTYLAQRRRVYRPGLAHVLDIEPMMLSRVLDQLQAAGFVAHMTYPEHPSVPALALTAKALPIIECIYGLTKKNPETRSGE